MFITFFQYLVVLFVNFDRMSVCNNLATELAIMQVKKDDILQVAYIRIKKSFYLI